MFWQYLLGQHCATDNEDVIQSGLGICAANPSQSTTSIAIQAELVKSTIKERGSHKVIDKLTVELNEKGGFMKRLSQIWALRLFPSRLTSSEDSPNC